MSVAADLERCGLKFTGRPKAAAVDVAGRTVSVRVDEGSDGVVVIVASMPAAVGARQLDVGQLALSAPGDTTFAVDATSITATRSLAEPDIGAAYDAVHDLAKAACSIGVIIEASVPDAVPTATSRAPAAPPPPSAGPPPAAPMVTVASPQSLTGGDGAVVGQLVPGRQYRAGRSEGGWIEVTDERGITGWVAESGVRRS